MSTDLSEVPTSSLQRLLEGLRAERVRMPISHAELAGFGVHEHGDTFMAVLGGHSRTACVSILSPVLAERAKYDRPAPELVWTGPEGQHALARDTAVVLRGLFESARERVVLGGYSFRNARAVLSPLWEAMRDRGVKSLFFVDVEQAATPVADPDARAQAALAQFLADNWPFGPPYPDLYCDRRALQPGPPWCSLHAKCVAVDGLRAFISSANFTTRGQERNIETGVLLENAHFAAHLERQWLSLIEGGFVAKHKGGGHF